MFESLFLLAFSFVVGSLFIWAFKTLPGEGWQILASVPVAQEEPHTWKGLNLTYYGLVLAISVVAALAVFLVLMAAVDVPVLLALAVIVVIFGVCVPAASVLARIVEQRPNTLTIGGASFLGSLLAPGVVWMIDFGTRAEGAHSMPLMPALAAMSMAYALGEGIGRLACISYGCCYGKPLSACHPIVQRLVGRHSFIFRCKTKKIVYESGMEGVEVIPIQAVTAVILVATALAGMALFLNAAYTAAFLGCMAISQGWRAVSEHFRADYRGNGKLSAYQIMAVLVLAYSVTLALFIPGEQLPPPSLLRGIKALWDPVVILSIEMLGLLVFLYTGLSKVTGSRISFQLLNQPIDDSPPG